MNNNNSYNRREGRRRVRKTSYGLSWVITKSNHWDYLLHKELQTGFNTVVLCSYNVCDFLFCSKNYILDHAIFYLHSMLETSYSVQLRLRALLIRTRMGKLWPAGHILPAEVLSLALSSFFNTFCHKQSPNSSKTAHGRKKFPHPV